MAVPTREDEMQAKMNEWCGTVNVDYLSEERGLSNLFKHAVPKVIADGFSVSIYYLTGVGEYKDNIWHGHIGCDDYNIAIYEKDKDPALALFWAIYKVMEVDNG